MNDLLRLIQERQSVRAPFDPSQLVAKTTMARLERDEFEIAVGMAQNLKAGAGQDFDQIFSGMNR